jgi:hypothetical protein
MQLERKYINNALNETNAAATVQSTWFDAEQYDEAVIYTNISATAAGTLQMSLEATDDDGTTSYTVASGAVLSSVTTEMTRITSPIGKRVRVVATLASTPDFTFTARLELARTGG